MLNPFKDFDFSTFWDNSEYALEEYVSDKPNKELIESIENELGYKLPDSYVEMMKIQNGGIPFNCCFPTNEPTSWADDHIAISGIYSIGREKSYALCGDLGSQFMIDEWGYPDIGICICNCPSAGHDLIMLDYRNCGKQGEPEVVHVDQESDYEITFLAKDFETFIRGLVNEDIYDTSEIDLKNALDQIKKGQFSTLLTHFFKSHEFVNFDSILRNILTELINHKGYFALHADELSYLVYDIQFYLYSNQNKISSIQKYLIEYPKMIAFGDQEINTGGYAPNFVSDWINQKVTNREIIKKYFKGYKFSSEYENNLLKRLNKYA
uniref:SMI1/KNR4 family protein n=1 Tax=Flavobacterium sp. TaxID=239 RepID=UPI00404A0DB6